MAPSEITRVTGISGLIPGELLTPKGTVTLLCNGFHTADNCTKSSRRRRTRYVCIGSCNPAASGRAHPWHLVRRSAAAVATRRSLRYGEPSPACLRSSDYPFRAPSLSALSATSAWCWPLFNKTHIPRLATHVGTPPYTTPNERGRLASAPA